MRKHMTILSETYTLSNGVEIPRLGLGTWFIDDDKAADAVRAAVAIDESLATMGVDHVDLMLIHSPQPWDDFRGGDYNEGNREAWRALEDAHRAGRIGSIGVSNFLQEDLDSILSSCTVEPHVDQLLVHAGNTPTDLIAYCESKGILVEAYSPIAHGEILRNTTAQAMAEKYGVTVPQLCIRYTLQLGTVSLPKTADPEHMRSNAAVDFLVSDEDMDALRDLNARDYGDSSAFPVYSGK